jgi:chemosensory pili system protein ChpA (sensor histidine kinase/response regulator)
VSENFDIGPLTWVKEEIDKSLDAALDSLDAFADNLSDYSPLRIAQTHIYQASGALDMVSLDGCKFFCAELERCLAKLQKDEIPSSLELVQQLQYAIESLKQYIEHVLHTETDNSLRLSDALKPIVEVQGREFDKTELFFPDITASIPKDIPSVEYSDEEYQPFILKQRLIYQKSLVNWLKTKHEEPLQYMAEAIAEVSYAQTRSASKAIWWVVSAFVESLKDAAVADIAESRRMFRKIDQEFKSLLEGVTSVNPKMFKEALYCVAFSQTDSDVIARVKQTYGLSNYAEFTSSQFTDANLEQDEANALKQLSVVVSSIRRIWNDVSNKIEYRVNEWNHNATVVADSVLITRCADELSAKQELACELKQLAVADLYHALSEALQMLQEGRSITTPPVLIDITAGVHVLENALIDYVKLDDVKRQRITIETKRLLLIATGTEYEQLALERSLELDVDTINTIVQHIHNSLQQVEETLDVFFRKTEDKSVLSQSFKPLKEVASIFQMLNMDIPANVAKISERYIDYFNSEQFSSNQGEFELLAESLSMLSLYAQGIPKSQPEFERNLQVNLERLHLVLANLTASNAQDQSEKQAEGGHESTYENAAIRDTAFDEELLDVYLTEAEEVLGKIAQHLQSLKMTSSLHEQTEIRRGFHLLKGSGRTVGLNALAEIAAKVEYFLNDLIASNINATAFQVNELEHVTTAFAGWVDELRQQHRLVFNPNVWIDRIRSWSQDSHLEPISRIVPESAESEQEAPIDSANKAFVLIGGKRKLSRQLYNIFLNESMLNITALEQDLAKMQEDINSCFPKDKAKHAIHKLASNALAAGFEHMGQLGRALESWIDAVGQNWSLSQQKLYSRAIKALARMWQAVSELKEPRIEKALLAAILKATPRVEEPLAIPELVSPASIDNISDQRQALLAESVSTAPKSVEPELVDEEILSLFQEEADELLPVISAELKAWQANASEEEHADALQRALHTLKGSARMASQNVLADIVHQMEERIVQGYRHNINEVLFKHLYDDLDAINAYFDGGRLAETSEPLVVLDATKEIQTSPDNVVIEEEAFEFSPQVEVLTELDDDPAREEDDEADDEAPLIQALVGDASNMAMPSRKTQSIRMRADVLDRLINEAGEVSILRSRLDKELQGFKHNSQELTDSVSRLKTYLRELELEAESQLQSRLTLLQEANETFDPLEFDRFTHLQELTRMMAESVNDISTVQNHLAANLDQAEAALQQQNRMNHAVQQTLMNVRMLPFSQISDRLDRVVRQTARELNKLVEFTIEGADTEVDRSVLDKIVAPLEHLLRNAVAHGLEERAQRSALGKDKIGQLKLKVKSENDEIHIDISDDGSGINVEQVRNIAIERQLINANAVISDQNLMALIFESGFSTSSEVSQIAGRGVGLDVVRNEVTALGGHVDVESTVGLGTRFSVHLPVTLTVAQVLIIRSGQTHYAISVAMIEQAQKVKHADILAAYAAGEVIWAGNSYQLHHIAKLLHEQAATDVQTLASILLLRSGSYRMALHVDEILGNQEVVVKPMGEALARVPGIMGASVAQDGRVMFILNPLILANREALVAGSVRVEASTVSKVEEPAFEHKLRLLIVDDSLTIRKVLGRLMEREGYTVLLAKDGMDAMQVLQDFVPDVILTDIEMPRLDGFGLARNIRNDARTKYTPLIMISSRTADKHQNLAKEIGVDAFFGKPVQDDELLAKVHELIASRSAVH